MPLVSLIPLQLIQQHPALRECVQTPRLISLALGKVLHLAAPAPPKVGDFNLPPARAAGGYVSGPTHALIGEGGQGEYVIPESKMRESMARYSRGARGSAVIPETGASGTSGEGGGTAVAAPIDVRYTVERINNVDYVTADRVPSWHEASC